MNRILGLDGIRAFAALSVIMSHLGIYNWLHNSGIVDKSITRSLDGVQAFFVISGFLITYLLIEEYTKTGESVHL